MSHTPQPQVPGQSPGRTLVMGVLNVTPDSFSDGGRWFDPDAAIAHGLQLVQQGADIVDVGGESTRPGADRPVQHEELRRVLPVVQALAEAGVQVSIDTMRASVAAAAIEAGAGLVNDVSGGLADPDMLAVVAEAGVDYCAMHWRGQSRDMQQRAHYDDVVAEVTDALVLRSRAAVEAGIAAERIILDPGYGFAKTGDHNWTLLAHQPELVALCERLGHRLLVGVSRKRFLGELLAEGGDLRPADERDDATLALTTLCATQGVWAVRTHTVRPHRDAVEVVARLRQG